MTSAARKDNPFALGLFSLTLFLSAALMFAIEPMTGKMLLPLVGGTPAGWIVAMAFFQVMLLLGYFYAHLLSRFSPRVHALLYLAVLVAGMACLPVRMPTADTVGNPGAWGVFTLLSIAVAIPFIALSATSSTLQRLFTTTGHSSARDPYFLYAASNLGSFAGLLLYPFAYDRAFGLHDQAQYWFYAFIILAGFSVLCLALTYKKAGKKPTKAQTRSKVTTRQKLIWIALAFFPSSLMLGITTHISTDLFSAPMIWVLPLAIYLLTFVIAFSRKPLVKFRIISTFQPVAVCFVIALLFVFDAELRISWYAILFHLIAFGAVALMCHMRLAEQRPLGNDRGLTEFYLMMSIGGALGGLLNAFIIPVALDRLIEYPAMMILSCLMNPGFWQKMPRTARIFFVLGMTLAAAYSVFMLAGNDYIHGTVAGGYTDGMIYADIILFLTSLVLATNVRAAFCGMAIVLLMSEFVFPRDVLLSERNFYGVIKVYDRPQAVDDKTYDVRFMVHGNTIHGMQIRDPAYETTPTSYFWKGGPAGDVFNIYTPKKVAIIGLGAGTMNCYNTPKSEFTFFEIDEAVKRIATDPANFTFMTACKGKRLPEVVIGDARLELARHVTEKFDLIVLDAFTSDAIPTHLLTLEALRVYLERLNPSGLILLHVSNRYFDLQDILGVNAHELGLKYRYIKQFPKDVFYASGSKWVVMSRRQVSLAPLEAYGWADVELDTSLRPWTDDYTNLLATLTFSGFMGGF